MKTDSIFYRLFQEFPGIFFELIGNSPETAEAYKFSSIEIKQTAFRIDGVFLPTEGEENPIYFVEVQFQTDTEIYSRLFSEIFLYLRQNKPKNSWRGVVIYPNRSLDTADIKNYSEFFTSGRVSRIYLDELGETASLPVGIATMKLVVDEEDTAITSARQLIGRTQQEINIEPQRRQLLELIETILVYKFPKMSRKEIEGMFGLSDLKQTRVYQEGKQEGGREEKFRMIPLLLRLGLSFEETAKELGLSLEEVQQEMQKQPPIQDI
ncbi:MAG: Rpn family recombination-promoting nuclease/putative transposase [Nostoc sp.]|uniref:Rpn family recombination-promoting nuclease/putative transposase n=1 Tax=Nostoc sp. TaxID=1180 RepID=UPI002FFD1C32